MNMNWENITVGQFLDLYKLGKGSDEDSIVKTYDKAIQAVCIIYNTTE